MAAKEWKGSFAIPMTPFDDHDGIDEDCLYSDWVRRSGLYDEALDSLK